MTDLLSLAALFFFTLSSLGFILCMVRFPNGSQGRIWGIRLSYLLGFAGVAMMWLNRGYLNQLSMMIILALVLSLLAFELTTDRSE